MRYRIEFHARKDKDFQWETNETAECDDLLEAIFKFQLMISREFQKIIDESKIQRMIDDDIPF